MSDTPTREPMDEKALQAASAAYIHFFRRTPEGEASAVEEAIRAYLAALRPAPASGEQRADVTEARAQFDAIMAQIPVAACVHGHPHASAEACEDCVASEESDPVFVLRFCEGAIRDAVELEDGLDGSAGEAVLAMIRNALSKASTSMDAAALPPARPAEPTYERHQCPECDGVGWYAAPDMHGEPEQVQCQRCDGCGYVEEAAPLPSGEPTSEAVAKCHYCSQDAVLVKERRTMQWGGAREGERPFFHEADAEYWRCASCGEEWYTVEQMRKLDSQLLKAITKEWRKLADAASPPQDAPPDLSAVEAK